MRSDKDASWFNHWWSGSMLKDIFDDTIQLWSESPLKVIIGAIILVMIIGFEAIMMVRGELKYCDMCYQFTVVSPFRYNDCTHDLCAECYLNFMRIAGSGN